MKQIFLLLAAVLLTHHSLYGQWQSLTDPQLDVECLYADERYIYAGREHPGAIVVLRSPRDSMDWTTVFQKSLPGGASVTGFTSWNGRLQMATTSGIYSSGDHGVSWSRMDPQVVRASFVATLGPALFVVINEQGDSTGIFRYGKGPGTTFTSFGVYRIRSLFVDGSRVYLSIVDDIYRSDDTGTTWTRLSKPPIPNDHINSLYARDSLILIGTSQFGVLASLDAGATWQNISTTWSNPCSYDVTQAGGTIFSGCGKRIDFSHDFGTTWSQSIPHTWDGPFVQDILVADGFLYTCGRYYGIWRRPLQEFGVASGVIAERSAGEIEIAPNPVRGMMSVSVAAPVHLPVHLALYDVMGNIVYAREYGDREREEQVVWVDCSGMAAGVYVCVVGYGEVLVTKRVLVVP